LGAFGNWYFENPTPDAPKSGNSILDQRMGMTWVHDHISKFNGDAGDITLAGDSAGGVATQIHVTHSDSHHLFKNAIALSPPQIPFWSEEQASTVYMNIATASGQAACGDPNLVIHCLRAFPLENFKGLAVAAKGYFAQSAIANNKLTQLEGAYGINIDGEVVTDDVYQIFKNKPDQIKSDLGFYVNELSTHEATTMVANLYKNAEFLKVLYGEHYENIFQSFNTHITVPQPAHDGLLNSIYGIAGAEFMAAILAPGALGCPKPENDPYHGLMTECKDQTTSWMTSWMWHCNIEDGLKSFPDKSKLYNVDFAASYPGPGWGEDGGIEPASTGESLQDCFEDRGVYASKACHVMGRNYLFGESRNQGVVETAATLQFGATYRHVYGTLIKTGQTAMQSAAVMSGLAAQMSPETPNITIYNKFDIGMPFENPMDAGSYPYAQTCMTFDAINSYGKV